MLSRSFGYCVCLLALISSASPVAAQDELSALPRSFPALQLTPEEQIELDGLLTESARLGFQAETQRGDFAGLERLIDINTV